MSMRTCTLRLPLASRPSSVRYIQTPMWLPMRVPRRLSEALRAPGRTHVPRVRPDPLLVKPPAGVQALRSAGCRDRASSNHTVVPSVECSAAHAEDSASTCARPSTRSSGYAGRSGWDLDEALRRLTEP